MNSLSQDIEIKNTHRESKSLKQWLYPEILLTILCEAYGISQLWKYQDPRPIDNKKVTQ